MSGTIVNSIGLIKSSLDDGSCIFLDDHTVDLDPPDTSCYHITSCQSQNKFSFSVDNCLTICLNKGLKEDDMFDVEVESSIQVSCWDREGLALLASDATGTLHLINSSGIVLFSRKITPGNAKADIIMMSFIGLHSSGQQSIICFLENGTILAVENLPVSDLCPSATSRLSSSDLADLFKKIKMSKCNTPFSDPQKVLINTMTTDDTFTSIIIDNAWGLHILSVNVSDDGVLSTDARMSLRDEAYLDAVLLYPDSAPAVALLLSERLDVTLLDMNSCTVIKKFSGSLLNPVFGGCDTFLMAEILRFSSPKDMDIVFSIGTSESNTSESSPPLSSAHVYTLVLLNSESMLLLDDWMAAPSGKQCPSCLTYTVGDAYSDNAGTCMTRWTSATEVSVMRYSEELRKVIDNVQKCKTVVGASETFFQIPDLVGCLLSPGMSSDVYVHIEERFASLEVVDMVLILRFVSLRDDCSVSLFRRLLLNTFDAMERSLPLQNVEQEVKYFLKCFQTASACEWPPLEANSGVLTSLHESPGASGECAQGEDSVSSPCSDGGEDMYVSNEDPVNDSDRLVMSRIRSLLGGNCESTYKACVASGHLQAASLILKTHLHGCLPEPCDLLLGSIDRGSCSINAIVEWVRHDLLPTLHTLCMEAMDEPADDCVAENMCDRLIDYAQDAERMHNHPFDAITASKLALQISSSFLSGSRHVSQCIIARARSVHGILALEAAAWTSLGLRVSFDVIEKSGLGGVVNVLLRSVDEKCIEKIVRDRVRPLIVSYGGDADDMLFKWIVDTLQSSVVSTDDCGDASEAKSDEDGNDEDKFSSVQFTRLVNVTEAITNANLKARAVISLLQMLSAPSCLDSSSKDTSSIVFEKLLSIRDHLIGSISASTADSLVEAFRTHKLRVIASKYSIKSLNLRDPRQIREAIGLIILKSHIPSSIADALNFAESYSSFGVDVSGLLVRGLVHRIFPDEVDGVYSEDIVKAALGDIPPHKLCVVAEESCSYLISVVDDICREASSCGVQLGSLHDKASEEKFCRAIDGVLQISSFLLDAKSDDKNVGNDKVSVKKPKSVKRAEGKDSFAISRNPFDSTEITTEFHSDVKRLKKLFSEFSVYINLEILWKTKSCENIVTQTATSKCQGFIKELDENKGLPSPLSTYEVCNELLMNSSTLSTIRKLCTTLEVSFIFALHSMQRVLLSQGVMELGMGFSDLIACERRDVALAGSTTSSLQGSCWYQSNTSSHLEDGELVLSSAISLCGAAAKKAQDNGKLKVDSGHRSVQQADIPEIAPFVLSGDLLRLSTLSCSNSTMGKTVDLLNACELVTDVYHRLEGSESTSFSRISPQLSSVAAQNPESIDVGHTPLTVRRKDVTPFTRRTVDHQPESHSSTNNLAKDQISINQLQSQISGSNFTKDGILLSPATLWGPLVKHLLMETKRREAICSSSDSAFRSKLANSDDVDKLVAILQRSENHLLAVRVILGSWHQYSSKKQSLHQSLTVLGRKVLSYRDIDTSLAVACLSSVPYEIMVRELRGAVPSIQSDFSRLRTVAQVGEQLANMWQQEELLVVFQSLQTNAKWWHVLSAAGVKIDPRAFQSSVPEQRDACIRAVVPPLLEKTGGDISLCMEYCSQFDLEAHFASKCYIEYTLLSKPSGTHALEWTEKIKSACSSVEESLLVSSLQSILPRIHQLDYEKIRYTCSWVLDILAEEDLDAEDGDENSDADSAEVEGSDEKDTASQGKGRYAELAEKCTNFLNIATFLSSLSIPIDMRRSLPEHESVYADLPMEYFHRIPFWELLKQPWVILEPLMNDSSELSSKLTPICAYLKLERDEYYVKRAMNLYSRSMNDLVGMSVESIGAEYDKVLGLVGDVVSYIKTPFEQIRVWKWIFDIERERYYDVALKALEIALDVFGNHRCVDVDESKAAESLKRSIVEEVVKHKCKSELLKLDKEYMRLNSSEHPSNMSQSLADRFDSSLGDLSNLIKILLEYTVENAWMLQLRTLRNTDAILSCFDILNTYHLPVISDFIDRMGAAIYSINQHHSILLDQPVSNDPTPPTPLQSVRHTLIGRLLADAEIQKDSNDRVMMSTNEKMGTIGQGGASSWGGGGWGLSGDSGVSPSLAEGRRREDLFKAFAISVLVASCTESCPRSSYITQLMVVGKGHGARSQRRLTARSKFRAIQGLMFLDVDSRQVSKDSTAWEEMAEESKKCVVALESHTVMNRLRGYLFCLAELQELRLPCSEETLANAVGFELDFDSNSSALQPSPSSLVSTWLHDEGHDSAVCELSRDVLITSRCSDVRLWNHLWAHMLQRGYTRAIIHTSVAIRTFGIFPSLVKDNYIASEMVESFQSVTRDVAERSEQIAELLNSRESKSNSEKKANSVEGKEEDDDKSGSGNSQKKSDTNTSQTCDIASSKRVVLSGTFSPWCCTQWDDSPEDIALTAQRLGHLWHTLSQEHQSLVVDISKLQEVCLRLISAAYTMGNTAKQHCAQVIGEGIAESITASIASCVGGLLDLVQTTLTHRSLYADIRSSCISAPLHSDAKTREFLVDMLKSAFGCTKDSQEVLTSHNDLAIRFLDTLLHTFGVDMTFIVLSRFCGFGANLVSKTLSYEDPDDSNSSQEDFQSKKIAGLFNCVSFSGKIQGTGVGYEQSVIMISGLLMKWVHSRDDIEAGYILAKKNILAGNIETIEMNASISGLGLEK